MVGKIFRGLFWLLVVVVFIVLALYFYNTVVVESQDAVLSAPSTTKFVDVDGEKLAYAEIDNHASTTVVFVGGLSAWGGTWERVVREANDKRKDLNYLIIDLPPFGYSLPAVHKNYFRDTQAKRIGMVIEAKKMDHIILVAHSYGAGPGTEYALTNPKQIEKLILIDGVLNIDEGENVSSGGLIQVNFLRDVLLGVLVHNDTFAISRFKSFVYIADHIDQSLLDIYTRYFNTKNTTKRLSAWLRDYVNDPLNYTSNFSKNYKNIRFPVRIIWGKEDTITPIDGTKVLLEMIPDVRLIALDGVGHIPMIEDYARFDSALLDALNK